ncbi:5-formyltetrahydrofolate cyclo-ligase [Thorsellia anophelis]|uniref:5-formyltetrahydrofolate cyclo-ligase n=1 Tax=Thorsellia anophelis DSM 18579 TaxID=1123402 RepID=A0A1I0A6E1_9GAMM|nr:5-formyltetrahydrofolate cyclo-ligase [Thorsellia anophelis]SES89687.1 5-formyltetrahydrofolate cyclo-ligase [Thorsellia anophelis DSM 18579]
MRQQTNLNYNKANFRKILKAKRLSLDDTSRNLLNHRANLQLIELLNELLINHRNDYKIALFLAFNGEIDPYCTIQHLQKNNVSVYLPIIHPFSKKTLLFQKFDKNTTLIKNKFGILEPKLDLRAITPLDQINYFVMPLTGFDLKGNRLGMGGGFYDRTLCHLNDSAKLIGFAYSLQQLDTIPTEPWDISLGYIVTELNRYCFI